MAKEEIKEVLIRKNKFYNLLTDWLVYYNCQRPHFFKFKISFIVYDSKLKYHFM